MMGSHSLDPRVKPPEPVRAVYKKYQKAQKSQLDQDPDILDFRKGLSEEQTKSITVVKEHCSTNLRPTFDSFCPGLSSINMEDSSERITKVYEHAECPGLHIMPSIVPLYVQRALLDRLLHRDLANPTHMTNVHLHHNLTYPGLDESFFQVPLQPMLYYSAKDPGVHADMSLQALLERKMRWMTLGGQYDWTRKEYPLSKPPEFPSDIADLLQTLCPDITPEAAICNLYSPGDTLSLHRDVSEHCDAPLLSLSIGCDAIFTLSALRTDKDSGAETYPPISIRLHSGDLVYMSGPARYAWHGVPKVISDTCPPDILDWPASSSEGTSSTSYEQWRGWMQRKRINLNVRQMFESY